jgi:NADPH2:quinone reductase
VIGMDLGGNVSPVYIGSFQAEPGDLEDLAARAADGRLRVEIGARYSLEDAVQAVVDFAGSTSGHGRHRDPMTDVT